MKTVQMPIAQPIGNQPIDPLRVEFATQPPSFHDVHGSYLLRVGQEWYRQQAEELILAMEATCPGGFMDALIGVLLTRAASIYVIPRGRFTLEGKAQPDVIPDGADDAVRRFGCLPSWMSDDQIAAAVQAMGVNQRARLLDAIEAVRDEEEAEG